MDRQLGRFPLPLSVILPLVVLVAGFMVLAISFIMWGLSPLPETRRISAAAGFISLGVLCVCLAALGISLTRLMWIRLTDNWDRDMHGIARDALIVRASMKRDHLPTHVASGDLDEEWRRYSNG